MPTPALIYIHGFNSSPQSWKAGVLKAAMQERGWAQHFYAPTLVFDPDRAMATLQACIESLPAQQQPFLVGSSMGGFYAAWLAEQYHCRAALVNPAVVPWELFEPMLAESPVLDVTNDYTGERYRLDHSHLERLKQYHVAELVQPENFLLLLQTGDETLDYRKAEALYPQASLYRGNGGSHGFDHFEDFLDILFRFGGFLNEPHSSQAN